MLKGFSSLTLQESPVQYEIIGVMHSSFCECKKQSPKWLMLGFNHGTTGAVQMYFWGNLELQKWATVEEAVFKKAEGLLLSERAPKIEGECYKNSTGSSPSLQWTASMQHFFCMDNIHF